MATPTSTDAPTIDDDTAHTVASVALDLCAVIRRDYRWAGSNDSGVRHARAIRDIRINFLPRFSPVMTATVRALLDAEVAAALSVF